MSERTLRPRPRGLFFDLYRTNSALLIPAIIAIIAVIQAVVITSTLSICQFLHVSRHQLLELFIVSSCSSPGPKSRNLQIERAVKRASYIVSMRARLFTCLTRHNCRCCGRYLYRDDNGRHCSCYWRRCTCLGLYRRLRATGDKEIDQAPAKSLQFAPIIDVSEVVVIIDRCCKGKCETKGDLGKNWLVTHQI